MSEETQVEKTEEDIINDEEAIALNKKIAAITGSFFRALASLTDEEIYEMKYTDAGKESRRLLEVVNNAYTEMLKVGGDVPCGHFDSYKRVVADFNNTLVFQIDVKLDANKDTLIAIATGKTESPDRISHQNIVDALTK